ncbi:helix-turn-helix domain-containing protein [Parapedobacter soli]|uniref:helix-turn-helix domain-containing protein n=1 Tax=Parapedobacter soli TaxID=416955 RepID=UPI0036F1EF8F
MAHLAELAGVNVNTAIRIERGQINPTLAVVNAIADVLGVEVIMAIKSNILQQPTQSLDER